MVKYVVVFLFTIFLIVVIFLRSVFAQSFDPLSVSDLFPSGGDVSNTNEGSTLSIVCTSCASPADVNQTFRVTVFDDLTSDPDNAYFEWVVFGATINSYTGNFQSSSNSLVGLNNRQYLKTQGIVAGESSITILMDTHLPDTVWVAVRQSSEYSCTDGKWSVHLMKADDINPEINFSIPDSWRESLVVVTGDAPIAVDLTAFADSIHAPPSSNVYNVDPSATDNCGTVDLALTIDGSSASTFATDYGYGVHALTSTATDCQGNNTAVTQMLYVYNPDDFSLASPPDSTFAINDCNPDDASFDEEMGRIIATFPAGWSIQSTASDLNNDQANVSGCLWSRTRTYTVTLIHTNNHNTRNITDSRTFFYTNDTNGPTLITKAISVNLDATGNATILPVDIVDRLYDDCADSASISVISFTPSDFAFANLGDNLVTLVVSDLCGRQTTETATVTINDAISPVITCQANASSVTDPGSCVASLTLVDPVASDNCLVDSVYWSMSGAANTNANRGLTDIQYVGTYPFPVGTTRVTYTVKDQSGNSASCFFDVTVTDNQIPTATGMPANLAHIAWEQRVNYTFPVPTISDNCNVATYTMSVNGGPVIDLLSPVSLMGTNYSINLNGEAPGDVNGNGVGVNNSVVFTYSDGVNPVQTYTWDIHVDYRPRVLTSAIVHPTCIGNSNGSIQLPAVTATSGHEIEVRNTVIVEYSYDNSTFIQAAGLLLINLSAGNYYFRVSTLVGPTSYRSYSDTLTVTLLDPPLIVLTDPASAVTNETCPGDLLGAINLSVTYLDVDAIPNPFRPYTMEWTKDGAPYSQTNQYLLTGLDSSVYHLRVTDNSGCWVEQTYVVAIDNNELPTITDATGISTPDPEPDADYYTTRNVNSGECYYEVTALDGFIPVAQDGACTAQLRHDYSGMPGHSWSDMTTLEGVPGARLPVGRTVITWTATDASGNFLQRAYAIVVTDNIPPSINDQLAVQFPYCDSVRQIPFPVISDNCGIDSVKCNIFGDYNWLPNINAGETQTFNTYHFNPTQTTIVTWTVWDIHGQSSSDSYDISFTIPIDTTNVTQIDNVSCNGLADGRIILDFAGGTSPYDVSVGGVFSVTNDIRTNYEVTGLMASPYTLYIKDSDNCEEEFEIVVAMPDPITASYTRTNNACFESNTGTLDLTVQGGNGGYHYDWSDPAYPYGDGHPWQASPILNLPDAEDLTGLPTGRYALIVTDARLCTANLTYDILSQDVTPPAFTAPVSPVLRNSNAGTCTYTVSGSEFDPTVTPDVCANLQWHNYTSAPDTFTLDGAVFNQGTTAVIWRVYDRSGNGNTFTVNYRVNDAQKPVFVTRPSDVHGYVSAMTCGYWLDLATARDTAMVVSDNCAWSANYLTYSRSDNSLLTLESPFEVKYPDADTIFWTLSDGAGNTALDTQLVYIRDTIDPVISNCGTPLTVYLRNNPANPNYELPVTRYENTISDNCGELDTIYANRTDNPLSRTFTCNDVGQVRSVNIYARDVWGNLDSCERQVNVLDTVRPLVGTTPRTIYLNPATATLSPSILNNGSLDNCDPTGASLQYRLLHNGSEQTDTTFDCSQIGIHPLTLRVYDRLPGGNYRDVNVAVTVADTIAPVATLFGSRPVLYINNLGGYTVVPGNLADTITDNCDSYSNLVLSANPSVVTCDSLGLTSVMLTMNDRWGNDRTVRVNVDVRDTIAPIVVLKNIEVRLGMGVSSDTTLTGEMFDNGSSDNCDNLQFWVDPDTFNCNDLGDNQVDVYVTDGHDTLVSEQTVTIITPVTIDEIVLNACNSSAFFSGLVTPAPADLDDYDWHWWSVPQNNGTPNDNIFCTEASDADIKHGGATCDSSSVIPEPYFCQPNNNEFYIRLVVKPKNSVCWSDTFTYFLNTQQGSATSMYIEDNIDACVGEMDTFLIEPINGSSAVTWSITGNGTIVQSYIASDRDSAWAIVEWTTPTPNYSLTGYLQLQVTYNTGGGSNGNKACNDVYRWFPWVHVAPTPSFVDDYSDLVCPGEEVIYRLSDSYVLYDWKGMTAGQIIGGGTPTDSFMVVRWNGLLGASDFLKVTVHNSDYCYDSARTDLITIEDIYPPVFTSTAAAFIRTMSNQTNRCDTILTGLPIPAAVDSCSGTSNANITLTYSIVNNSVPTDTIWKGDPTNYNSRRLNVGVWKVTWVVKDAGLNQNFIPFTYTITVNDGQNPVFTTTPNVFYFESNSGTCGYTHNNDSLDLTASDNCMPIDTIWCQVGASSTRLKTLNGYSFTSSVNPVTWYVRDRSGRQTTHTYTVNISDAEDPQFSFGTFPADVPGVVNYEGSFAANTRFYVFEDSHADSFEVTVPAIITDNCIMGPVLVTLTFPDLAQQTYSVSPPSSGNIYEFKGMVPLGRSVIDWAYSDAAGNELTMSHRVIFASHYGFECGVDETMWEDTLVCNPVDFSAGEAIPSAPDWFNTLRTLWNALNYTFAYNIVLNDPVVSDCKVYRDKLYEAVYHLYIVGNPTSQLMADAGCTQVFEYTIDTIGPVITETNKADLILECGNYAQTDIDNWLDSYAGIDPDNDIHDHCLGNGFFFGNDYSGLAGASCGADSITPVEFTVQDSCGNVSTYTANIRLRDTGDPWFTIGGVPVTAIDVPHELILNNCPVVIPTYTLVADDDCDTSPNPVVYVESDNRTYNGTCSDNTYDITRNWTVTDDCGNDSVWTQVVHVVDDTPPVWDPAYDLSLLVRDTTVNCGVVPPTPNIPDDWYIEDCDVSPREFVRDVSTQDLNGANVGHYNYTIQRYWSVEDNCNPPNAPLEWLQTITVHDTLAPQINTAASDATVECQGIGVTTAFDTWLANRAGTLAADNCATINFLTWTNNDPSSWNTICGNSRSKTVTFRVQDPTGNADSSTATFTYTDTQAPTYTGAWPVATDAYWGPYDSISVIPSAYTTVTEIENRGITISDGCALDADLTVSVQQDTIYLVGCNFNLRRTYTVRDGCNNPRVLPAQLFTVRDGVKPTISKALSSISGCALDPVTQTTTIAGLALKATDISDNCSAGSYFITNANTRMEYQTYHSVSGYSAWTFGNPDQLVFQEGITGVYYRVTDANNNTSIIYHLYNVTVKHMPVISPITTTELTGIVGGANNPLRFSTHTYTVTMAVLSNLLPVPVGNTGWRIYPAGNHSTPVAGSYSNVVTNAGNTITATITFDGTLVEGAYDLVFIEQDVEGCFAEETFPFSLGAPFDVDIDDMANQCPDVENEILEVGNQVQADGTGTTTTILYHIRMLSPANYQNDWEFDYSVTTDETGGGTDATIQSVVFTDNGTGANLGTPPTGTTGTVHVDYNSSGYYTNDITMTVVFEDRHSTTQLVNVVLTGITGSSGEIDLNVALGTDLIDAIGADGSSDQNNTRHLINNLPLPGNLAGVE